MRAPIQSLTPVMGGSARGQELETAALIDGLLGVDHHAPTPTLAHVLAGVPLQQEKLAHQ